MATVTRSGASQHWSYFLDGVVQASNWPKTFILFYSSSTIQKAMLNIFILNGVMFLGSVLILETFYNTPAHRAFGCSYASLAGYPMYILLLALNGKFYSPIAEKAYQVQTKNSNMRPVSQSMASTIYTVIFYINCSVFAALVRSMIPYFGTLLAFLINCAVMAYYCFEYKWLYMGWTLERRLTYVEQHWAYFLGFGLPITFVTFFLSTLHAGAVFGIIYPAFVIMATMASPKPTSPYGSLLKSGKTSQPDLLLPNKLPLFLGVRKLNHLAITLIKLAGGIHADSIVSENQKMNKLE